MKNENSKETSRALATRVILQLVVSYSGCLFSWCVRRLRRPVRGNASRINDVKLVEFLLFRLFRDGKIIV